MKQRTVKCAVEAWHWIANNPHNEVGLEFRTDAAGRECEDIIAIFFRNYHEKLRVPEKLRKEVMAGLMPNRRKFDTRMYALRKHARLAVS